MLRALPPPSSSRLPGQPAFALPPGILARVPLPDELVDAIAAALDREAAEMDLGARGRLLAGTRTAIESWVDGSASTAETVGSLRTLAR